MGRNPPNQTDLILDSMAIQSLGTRMSGRSPLGRHGMGKIIKLNHWINNGVKKKEFKETNQKQAIVNK